MRGRQTKKKKKDFQLIVSPDQGLGIEGARLDKGGRRGRRTKERKEEGEKGERRQEQPADEERKKEKRFPINQF